MLNPHITKGFIFSDAGEILSLYFPICFLKMQINHHPFKKPSFENPNQVPRSLLPALFQFCKLLSSQKGN